MIFGRRFSLPWAPFPWWKQSLSHQGSPSKSTESKKKLSLQYNWLEFQATVFENRQKKSHSTLRAKRATFTFWVKKVHQKMPKMVNLVSFDNLKFVVKQCYQTCQFQSNKNCWTKPKLKNTNERLWGIFKQCDFERQIPERLAKALKVWQPGFEDSDTVEYTKVVK